MYYIKINNIVLLYYMIYIYYYNMSISHAFIKKKIPLPYLNKLLLI